MINIFYLCGNSYSHVCSLKVTFSSTRITDFKKLTKMESLLLNVTPTSTPCLSGCCESH